MKRIPKLSIFLATLFLGIALSFPIQIAVLFEDSIFDVTSILGKITWLNWAVICCCLLNSYLILRLSSRLRYTIALNILLVLWNNDIVAMTGLNYSYFQSWGATLCFTVLCGLLLMDPYREIITNPQRRWWLVPKRFRATLPVEARLSQDLNFYSNTYDLSKEGAFLAVSDEPRDGEEVFESLESGSTLDLSLKVGYFQKINITAKVVRKSPAKGQYPSGIGVQFIDMNKQANSILKQYIASQA